MPTFINPNISCCKCFRIKITEYDRLEAKDKVLLDIGSIILMYPNGTSEWLNICSQHQKALRIWLRNGIEKLPRQVELQQSRLS